MASRIATRPLSTTASTASRLSMGSSASPVSARGLPTGRATGGSGSDTSAALDMFALSRNKSAVSVAKAGQAAQEKKEEPKYNDDDKPYVPVDEEPPEAVDPSEEDTAGSGDEGYSILQGENIPFVSSHISKGCLNTLGFACTEFGWEPVTSSVYLHAPDTARSIPVDFGYETESPTLNQAMIVSGKVLARETDKSAQKVAAGSLVRRARLGDQNAMALISETRTQAMQGNQAAQSAFGCIQEYIQANPAGNTFHGESNLSAKAPKMWAHIWLANGPLLTNDRIREFASSFGEDTPDRQAFLQGLILFKDKDRLEVIGRRFDELQRKIIEIGRMFGEARALQHVRSPQLRISDYLPIVGWELGE